MQQLLILGGTQFIGRNLVERLIGRKDLEITLFNRQKNYRGHNFLLRSARLAKTQIWNIRNTPETID